MLSSAWPRRKRAKPTTSLPDPAAPRDWAALPYRILLDVFLKLGPREVMLGAEFACTAWRRVAVEEPALWRRVGWEDPMDFDRYRCFHVSVRMAMAWVAVARAAGQCEAFKGDLEEEDLPHLVERAPSLRRLYLDYFSDGDSVEELVVALKKLPLLEDLQLSLSFFALHMDGEHNVLQCICQVCPGLKTLVVMYASYTDPEYDAEGYPKEPIDGGITVMPNLRSLELYDCDLSVKGLNDILDNCPLLESLVIYGYFNNGEMDKDLMGKLARLKNLSLPTVVAPMH
ncbi:hypothetical protein EJB05_52423, partial [Eragrostis curvula]